MSRICSEQRGDVEHRHAEPLADEVACVDGREAVRGRAVTVEDEDPFETVLRELRADVREQRAERRLPQRVGSRVNRPVAEHVGAAVTVGDRWHHHDVPSGACAAHLLRDGVGLVNHGERVGSDRQVRAVLLDHSYRQNDQSSSSVECVDLRPGELIELVDGTCRARCGALHPALASAPRSYTTPDRTKRRARASYAFSSRQVPLDFAPS